MWKIFISLFVLGFFSTQIHIRPTHAQELPPSDLEKPTCGIFGIERELFEVWQAYASRGDSTKLSGYTYEPKTFSTTDGRNLVGFRVTKDGVEELSGALIVLQGNAMGIHQLADDIYPFFADAGLAVYAFSYRGYGQSQGAPYFSAIFSDVKELLQYIRDEEPDGRKIFLYGMSIGSIIGIDLLSQPTKVDKAVFDSIPSKLKWTYLCPNAYNPFNKIPEDASSILVIVNEQDHIFSEGKLRKFADEVIERDGSVVNFDSGHPLQEEPEKVIERLTIVRDHFIDN